MFQRENDSGKDCVRHIHLTTFLGYLSFHPAGIVGQREVPASITSLFLWCIFFASLLRSDLSSILRMQRFGPPTVPTNHAPRYIVTQRAFVFQQLTSFSSEGHRTYVSRRCLQNFNILRCLNPPGLCPSCHYLIIPPPARAFYSCENHSKKRHSVRSGALLSFKVPPPI